MIELRNSANRLLQINWAEWDVTLMVRCWTWYFKNILQKMKFVLIKKCSDLNHIVYSDPVKNIWPVFVAELVTSIHDRSVPSRYSLFITYQLIFPYLQERFWEQCIFKYLRAEPEDHYFLLVSFIFMIIYTYETTWLSMVNFKFQMFVTQ